MPDGLGSHNFECNDLRICSGYRDDYPDLRQEIEPVVANFRELPNLHEACGGIAPMSLVSVRFGKESDMRCHYKLLILVTCVAGALPVSARGDEETLDFFKRFLDSSPRTEVKSTDLADEWMQKVDRSETVAEVRKVEPLRTPIKVAQRPTPAVPRPAVRDSIPTPNIEPVPTPKADPISQPQVAELSPEDLREAKRLESKVNRQVQNLQVQLEREEKSLEQNLASFNKRREVALEKADEKELKRIEQLEQTAVASYEKRIQRLMNTIAPDSQSVPTKATAATRAPRTPQLANPRTRQPVQRPVANRRLQSTPQQARPQQATARSQQAQAQQKQFQARAEAARRAAEAAKRKPPAAPQKKRFKLWPFK